MYPQGQEEARGSVAVMTRETRKSTLDFMRRPAQRHLAEQRKHTDDCVGTIRVFAEQMTSLDGKDKEAFGRLARLGSLTQSIRLLAGRAGISVSKPLLQGRW